jgi:UDP-2-acetamido-3-amino-2,3-dideoxy-glucuronate N-acetyltransferase
MNNPPSVGVAGCGYWGRNLVRIFYSLGALKKICEPSADGRAAAQKLAPLVPFAGDFAELITDPEINVVAIATPSSTHFELAEKALLAGKHVFVEKPMAISVKDGERLVKTAEQCKKILMVGHILSYHPAVTKLKQLVDQGELGNIHYINSHRLNFGKFRREENILWSFAPHDISTILMLLDEQPEKVRSFGGEYLQKGIYDFTLTTLDFGSGAKGHIFVSWLYPFKEQKLVVVGSKRMAVFDDTASNKLVLYPTTIQWQHRTAIAQKIEPEPVNIDSTEPLLLECQHFLECAQKNARPKTDAAEGLRVLQILAASEESLRQNGATVTLHGSAPASENKFFVHPSTILDANVVIGERTKIWHFSHVLPNCTIGADCTIGQNVMIGPDVTIGNNVKIQNNVSVYKGVTLESDVFCGPSMVFTNVINPRSAVSRKNEFKPTHVGKGASLGANCTVIAGIRIGRYAFAGAGAVLTKDVPDYALVIGNPARVTGWMCECGVKLHFENSKSSCAQCGRSYKMTGKTVQEA